MVVRSHFVKEDYYDPAQIGRAISAMLSDKDRLVHMRENALAAARSDLCWERESQRLIGLYQDILYK